MSRRLDTLTELLGPAVIVILVLLLRPAGLFAWGRRAAVERV